VELPDRAAKLANNWRETFGTEYCTRHVVTCDNRRRNTLLLTVTITEGTEGLRPCHVLVTRFVFDRTRDKKLEETTNLLGRKKLL